MNRPCVALTNNPGLKWKNPTPEPWCATNPISKHGHQKHNTHKNIYVKFSVPNPKPRCTNPRTPKPESAGSRVSGVRNSELGRIWGDQYNLIYNRVDWQHIDLPMFCNIFLFRHTEFRVPDTGDPRPETAGSRVSGTRNWGKFGEINTIWFTIKLIDNTLN